jgi:hypothetical protein
MCGAGKIYHQVLGPVWFFFWVAGSPSTGPTLPTVAGMLLARRSIAQTLVMLALPEVSCHVDHVLTVRLPAVSGSPLRCYTSRNAQIPGNLRKVTVITRADIHVRSECEPSTVRAATTARACHSRH